QAFRVAVRVERTFRAQLARVVGAHDLQAAGGVAAVVVEVVAVVATLALGYDAVTAARDRAVVVAPVAVDRVPVVAFLAVAIDHAVAAHLALAGLRASLARAAVAVVAFLARVDDPVPTARESTVGVAAVAVGVVAIVALLTGEGCHNAVAAPSELAGVRMRA